MTHVPTATIRRKPRFSFVWLVPLVCLAMAASYALTMLKDRGPAIAIHLPDAEGITPGKTLIKHRGVTVGEVTGVEVEAGSDTVKVSARLRRAAADLAREGTVFVVVKPQVSFEGVEGLTTIFSGSSLSLEPGQGEPATDFRGFADGRERDRARPGLSIILAADKIGSIGEGDGVTFRGLRVGSVTRVAFNNSAQKVLIHVKIDEENARLVRENTRFWNAGGVDAKVSLLGAKVRVDSVQALWNGGIAFATPDDPGRPAKTGAVFPLEEKPDRGWESWSPRL